jgi:uncharacterized protein
LDEHVLGLEVGLGRVADEGNLLVSVRLEAIVEGILASGTVSGAWELACSRCTAGFSSPIDVGFQELFTYEGIEAEETDYRVEGEAVDLLPMVRDVVLLAMPMNPLHDPGCKGLCPVCGQDLNLVDCGHEPGRKDARWEPLRRLRDQMGE